MAIATEPADLSTGAIAPAHGPTHITDSPTRRRRMRKAPRWLREVVVGASYYYLTSLVVVVAAIFAYDHVPICDEAPSAHRTDLLSCFSAWDGQWYILIAEQGYSYDPARPSNVAFFPAFPLFARFVAFASGLSARCSLLLTAHAFLLGAFILLAAYARARYGDSSPETVQYILLALGLFPTTFYIRMAYSESMLLFLAVLALFAMQRKWHILLIVMIIGAATATRPVGVGLLVPLTVYLWSGSRSWKQFLFQCCCTLPPACWGAAAYLGYQLDAFQEPAAFMKTQRYWGQHSLPPGIEGLWALATLEPIRSVYDSSSSSYWASVAPRDHALFNMKFMNPVWFLLAIGLIGFGARRRWLNVRELSLAVTFLAIPYILTGYRSGMMSQARFATVAFPVYLVLGRLLSTVQAPLAAGLCALATMFLACYTMLFVSWYAFY